MDNISAAYEAYRQRYAVLHPPPVLRRPSFIEEVGLDSALTVVTVIAAVILSSIRTGTIFALTEASLLSAHSLFGALDGILPALAALSALAAVEGTLVVAGYIRARNEARQDIPQAVVLLALATVIVAGMQASLVLLRLPDDNPVVRGVTWALAALTAVAPPLIAYYGGHIIGAVHVRWNEVVRRVREQFEADMSSWEAALYRSFVAANRAGRLANELANLERTNEPANRRTGEPANRRTNEHGERTNLANERTNERTGWRTNQANERTGEPANRRTGERTNRFGTGERGERVRQIIETILSERGEWPSNREVCEILAATDGGRPPEAFKGFVSEIMKGMKGG